MGMRNMKRMFCAALALAGGLGFGATARAVTCTSTITGGTLTDVLVPPGDACILQGVTVTGNVVVQSGASFGTSGTTSIGGNLLAVGLKGVGLGSPSMSPGPVGGNLIVDGATFSSFLCTPHVTGNVAIVNTDTSAAWCIGGKTSCSECENASMTVGGNFEVDGNAVEGNIGGDTIHGNLLFDGNTGGGDLETNTVGGNLQFNNNSGSPQTISNNTITGNLACSGNQSPGPSGSGNTAAAKLGQCSGL